MQDILNLGKEELQAGLARMGEPAFRSKQIWQWLHQKLAASFSEMTNLGKTLQQKLAAEYRLRALNETEHLISSDQLTEKWLFHAPTDGSPLARPAPVHVECVLIREQNHKRRTLCISCMSGCPIGCAFCATGQDGFERNLSVGEILEQVYRGQRHVLELDQAGLTNLVFMGMGEPLLNYDNVLRAASLISSEDGINLGGRHITLSTVGVPSGIRRLCEEGHNFRLALSLHAPDQQHREEIIPAAKRWPLTELLPALREFAAHTSRQLTIEYCLIHQFNDRKAQARQLAELLRGIPCKINLIPLNPTPSFDRQPPPPDKIRAFQETLESHGLSATLRQEKGADIDAACGQLRSRARKQ